MANLTCISYDGDDTNTKPAPQSQPEVLSDHKAEKLIVVGTVSTKDEIKYDEPIKEEPEAVDQNHHVYSNGQNSTPAWVDGQANGRHDNNFGDGAAEEESRGIGIKEDG